MVKANVAFLSRTLSAQVRRVRTGKLRCPVATQVVICHPKGGQVARAVLGGDYSCQQALAEYLRAPARFEELPGGRLVRLMGVRLP